MTIRALITPNMRFSALCSAVSTPSSREIIFRKISGPIRRTSTPVSVSRDFPSEREVVSTTEAPSAFGPYSQAVKTNSGPHSGLVFVAGQLGVDPQSKEFVSTDVAEQTDQALKNLGAILKASGSDYSRVVKTMVLLADMADFKAMNEVYAKYFSLDPPARTAYAAKELPLGAKVEIEAIAQTK